MAAQKGLRRSKDIRGFILVNVEKHPKDIIRKVSEHFSISRQAAGRHIKALVDAGLLETQGKTRAKSYQLKPLVDKQFLIALADGPEEDIVWRESVLPLLSPVKIRQNVVDICQYGFTEILNNALHHSLTTHVVIHIILTGVSVEMGILDSGIGIFQKLQQELGLNDPRHALLEITKGKLTTDPDNHTGEGIFFTSRMFDKFSILSGGLFFSARTGGRDWFIESEERQASTGTYVSMQMNIHSTRTTTEIFDRYTSEEGEYRFSRTLVPVKLAQYGTEQLVSRSQARRVLARFDKFKEIVLDFSGVPFIGRAFADEIFRIFPREHPDIHLYPVQMSDTVEKAINLARRSSVTQA